MAGRPSGFKTAAAREAYCRLYDEAMTGSFGYDGSEAPRVETTD
jgi:hypothetical protein